MGSEMCIRDSILYIPCISRTLFLLFGGSSMRRAVRRHPALAAIAATVALTVGLTGCHATEDSGKPPSIQASVGEAATNVNVVSPILVQATSGTLGSVRLTNDETGKEVKGTQEGNHWSSTEPLG